MGLTNENSKLIPHGIRFHNHAGAPGEGAADAFGMSNAVSTPISTHSSRIIVGGKIGLRADDTAPSDLEEELEQAFKNVELALQAGGLGADAWEYVYKVIHLCSV